MPSKKHVDFFLPFFLHETSSTLASPRRRHTSGDLSDEDISALVRKVDVLKQKVEPVIRWLEEAEEESE